MPKKQEDYAKCLKYINSYWKTLTFSHKKTKGAHIGLPNKFISPNATKFEHDQFYWDSYFTILGLVVSGKQKVELAKGMIDNFLYLWSEYGIIPSRNRMYNLGISQIPFLTSMAREVYARDADKRWLRKVARVSEEELKEYWMGGEKKGFNVVHLVHKGLSRYADHFGTHLTAEHESGWDMTSRFHNHALDYLPVDLNTCLYVYERDLAWMYGELGDTRKKKRFTAQANRRKKTIQELMWNAREGFYFDYNYKNKKQSTFYSLAGYYPLWAGIATKEQAKKMVRRLRKFERKGGLANTEKGNLFKDFPRQWDHPNGWPGQQWIVVGGLMDYEYDKQARRVAGKWLNCNKKLYDKTGKFWEKYNVVTCGIGFGDTYTTQDGFGWTNGVFVRLVHELGLNTNRKKK